MSKFFMTALVGTSFLCANVNEATALTLKAPTTTYLEKIIKQAREYGVAPRVKSRQVAYPTKAELENEYKKTISNVKSMVKDDAR